MKLIAFGLLACLVTPCDGDGLEVMKLRMQCSEMKGQFYRFPNRCLCVGERVRVWIEC